MKLQLVAVNEDGRKVYAKADCRKCHGRGYTRFFTPNTRGHQYPHRVMCSCAVFVNSQPAAAATTAKSIWWVRFKAWLGMLLCRFKLVRA